MAFDLESLEKSIDALQRSIHAAERSISEADADLAETIRAGVIQHFEVAYEQCWKFVQRWIRENRNPEEADFPRSRKELFRSAARNGLISDPIPWLEFGEARNLAMQTYDNAKAFAGYETAQRFLPYAEELLARLRKTND